MSIDNDSLESILADTSNEVEFTGDISLESVLANSNEIDLQDILSNDTFLSGIPNTFKQTIKKIGL